MPVSMNNSKKSNKSRASQSFSQTRGFTLTTTQSTERTNIIMNHIGKNFTNRTENECSYDKKTKENKERLKQVSNGVKYASLIALMSFVAGYAIGYGPGE